MQACQIIWRACFAEREPMNKVIIVGGGAAGMLASVIAARNGCEVLLFEKNEKLGKKVYITGKGRCNVTNNCDPEELLQAVMSNPKFLYSAFYSFTSQDMMHLLEEAVIRVCASYGITAGRVEKATGVWLDGDSPRARKICAIGVRSSHYVTMHGLALNVNTDLRYFSYIHPCGFIDKGVTSLQKELGREVPADEVKQRLCLELKGMLEGRR